MHKILVIRLYFPLHALHVSDYISLATARRTVPACTKCDVQLIKVAPDCGLIQSETCRASNGKMKSNHKNLVHIVGLYTYFTITSEL